ncbi:MAG: sigma 54-interacting transcriptional regulator [Desulfosoma sp.]
MKHTSRKTQTPDSLPEKDGILIQKDPAPWLLDIMQPLFLMQPTGIITFVNRAGRKLLNLMPGDDLKKAFPHLWSQVFLAIKDGSVRYGFFQENLTRRYLVHLQYFTESPLGPVVLCQFKDDVELDEITRSLLAFPTLSRELDAIIDSSADGLWISDAQGTVLRINRASERLNGLKAQDVVGRNMRELVEEGLVDCSATLEVIRTGQIVNLLQNTRSGRKLMLTGNPVLDPQGRLSLIVVNERDITEIDALYQSLEREKALKDQYKNQILDMQLEHLQDQQIIARSPSMVNVLHQAFKVSAVDSTVLLHGESGVGKGLIAELIHKFSPRSQHPMIRINCGAIPETLIEAELFGYERGAFTGARHSGKPGYFEAADGGTLLLDEVSELPLNSQVKLLRFLEDGRITRIGGTTSRKLDVRILAATNRDLATMVQRGEFRKDLYYRLNVIPLWIPPLRDRKECIFPMLQHYLERFCTKLQKPTLRLSRTAADALISYDFPGNVRELVNLCERLAVMCDHNPIRLEDLPRNVTAHSDPKQVTPMVPLEGATLSELMASAERCILRQALESYGSQWAVARKLGVNQSTVSRKIKKYGLHTDPVLSMNNSMHKRIDSQPAKERAANP